MRLVVDAHEPVRHEFLQGRDESPDLAPRECRPRIRPGECEPGEFATVGLGELPERPSIVRQDIRRPGGGDLLSDLGGQPSVVVWPLATNVVHQSRPLTAAEPLRPASVRSRHPVPRLPPKHSASYVGRCLWPFRKRRSFSRRASKGCTWSTPVWCRACRKAPRLRTSPCIHRWTVPS